MGKFDGKFFAGPVGPVIFRKSKGKQIVSVKPLPGTVKQTENTKKASGTFGMASLMTSQIREGFSHEISNLHDGSLHSRLMTTLNPILSQCRDLGTMKYDFEANSFNRLQGLNFNIESPLEKKMGVFPEIKLENNKLQVVFPSGKLESKIKFIKGSTYCNLTLSLLLFRLKDGLRSKTSVKETIRVDRMNQEPLGNIAFEYTVPNGCLCVLGIFLKYHNYKYMLNTNSMSPAAICFSSVLPGDFDGENTEDWYDMGQQFD